jgi:hypothetical protein
MSGAAVDALVERAGRLRWLAPDAALDALGPEAKAWARDRADEHIAALAPFPMGGAYGATKAGVESFLASLRVDLDGSGVGVTCVTPGFVHTEMTAKVTKKVPLALTAPGWAGLTRCVPSPKSGGPAGSETKKTWTTPFRGANPVPSMVMADGLLAGTEAGSAPPLMPVIVGAL